MITTTTATQHYTRATSQLPKLRLKVIKCIMIRKILFADNVSVYIEFYMNSISYRIQRVYKSNESNYKEFGNVAAYYIIMQK